MAWESPGHLGGPARLSGGPDCCEDGKGVWKPNLPDAINLGCLAGLCRLAARNAAPRLMHRLAFRSQWDSEVSEFHGFGC